jgi:hypothetical protein
MEAWSTKQAQIDPRYERCVSESTGLLSVSVSRYMAKKKLDHLFGQQMPSKPEVRNEAACFSIYCTDKSFTSDLFVVWRLRYLLRQRQLSLLPSPQGTTESG